ncbi:MAG: LuxR C-terminal-related transcriptional regulator [Anaerolineales bacterium]
MVAPLLHTKLNIPQLRPGFVSRPRLIDQLNKGLNRKLILISAPAGFGKTTLLCQWIYDTQLPTSWLSLDEEDNDFTRFLSYLIAALQNVHSSIDQTALALLHTPQTPSIKGALTVLLNQLEEIPYDFLLVLDDYHLIEDQTIHQAIDFLLSYLPAHMHLAIISRADPPLHLARLRAQDQLLEVRMSDLRFNQAECTQFISKVLDTNISKKDLVKLQNRTEGWVSGLQMAVMTLQGREDISEFIDSFSGSHRYILDYLIEEVLQRQSQEIRLFLFQTSILTRFSSALCNAVTGQENSQEILAYLDKSNLFIIPLDVDRSWYRYHRLFSDLLRARLEQRSPADIAELHRRASRWFEENGFPYSAIDHALNAKDYQRAVGLIENIAEKTLMEAQITTLLRWRDKIPQEQVAGFPNLAFIFLWAHMLKGYQFDEVRMQVEMIENAQQISPGWQPTLLAFMEVSLANMRKAGEYAYQALQELDPDESYFRSIALWIYGISKVVNQNLQESFQVMEELFHMNQVQENVMFGTLTASQLGKIQLRLGNLKEAERIYLKSLETSHDRQGNLIPIAGEVLEGLGELYLELNQLDEAADCLWEAIELTKQWRDVAALEAYITLARVKQAQGDWEAARDAIDKAMDLAIKFDVVDFDDRMVKMWQARLWIGFGDLDQAERWAAEIRLQDPSEISTWEHIEPTEYQLRLRESLVATILLVKQKKYAEALDRIDWYIQVFKQQGRTLTMLEAMLLKAEALYGMQAHQDAMVVFNQVVEQAEPAGYMRLFLDQGEPVKQLLRRSPQTAYTDALLSAFEGVRPKPDRITQPLVEPLSPRELDVLRLLPTNLTTPEMAETLYIGVNTVRSHIKNIYSKLGVHKRSEAVTKARDLDII